MEMNIPSSICICGAGTMGRGIALASAQVGYDTLLFDISEQAVRDAADAIRLSLNTLASKNKITEEQRKDILQRLAFTSDISRCRAGLLIEAIVEDLPKKISLFRILQEINDDQAVFTSNTSSISVNAIAGELERKENFAGLHFFNPPTVMKLVEIIRGKDSSQAVIIMLDQFVRSLGKVPVVCNDAPGFIVNHVARPYYLEALRLVESGDATVEEVDRIMEATGFKMGPFKLMDLIGNDINYSVSTLVYEGLGKPERLKPSTLQELKVKNGELGRKTGSGYYHY